MTYKQKNGKRHCYDISICTTPFGIGLKLLTDNFKTPLQRKLLTAFRNNLARTINLMGEETVCRSQECERKGKEVQRKFQKYHQLAYSTHSNFLGGKLQVVGPGQLCFLGATAEAVFSHSCSERLNVAILCQLLQLCLIPYFIIICPISIVGQ